MERGEKVPLRVRLAYSVGHLQNDLMASMWFSYLLIYLHKVRNFNNIYAGTLLLVGQIADAIATPLIGFEADATSGFCGYTKRKSWHAIGLICTTCSFPFIFAPVIGATENTPDYALFIYYAAFVVIFQIGWASVQISHLSLIPQLTSDKSEVAGLNGWRYAATGIANLLTYAIAWVILSSPGSGSSSVDSDSLGPGDDTHFRNLGFVVTGIGVVASFIFHVGVTEPKEHHEPSPGEKEPTEIKSCTEIEGSGASSYGCVATRQEGEGEEGGGEREDVERAPLLKKKKSLPWGPKRRGVCQWLSDPKFYQVALIYMCTRLYVNISQVYLPMFLTETVNLDKVTIANVPLVCFASSFVTSTMLKIVDRQLGRKLTYVMGLVVAVGASTFAYFIPANEKWMVYTLAVFIGMGGALMLITSLSFVADLIGEFTGSSAFVYGSMSFTDKLANGVAVEVVQIFHPCVKCCPACAPYYRHVQSFVPGGAAVLAFIGLLTLLSCTTSKKYEAISVMSSTNSLTDARSTNGGLVQCHRGETGNRSTEDNGSSSSVVCTVVEVHDPRPLSVNDGRIDGESYDNGDSCSLAKRKRSILDK